MPELKGQIPHHANTDTSPVMTMDMTVTESPGARALSTRTLQTYGQDWALFTDWCAATGHPDLPADPDTILQFLVDCPASRSTQRCRVAAIDHHHTTAGVIAPGDSTVVRAALGRPAAADQPAPRGMTEQVAAAMRGLPSHGWTQGMFGRRDRFLLVLSQVSGVPYRHLATLTTSAVEITDGTATITSPAGTWSIRSADGSPLLCGSCAITRWLRVLDVVMTKPIKRMLAKQIADADPVTDQSPHLCRSTRSLSSLTLGVPLLPPLDQWGYVPFPVERLTPHSLSRRVRDILAGDLGAHRHLPVDPDEDAESEQPGLVPVEGGRRLPEPDLNLSAHPAPSAQPSGRAPSRQCVSMLAGRSRPAMPSRAVLDA